MTFLVFSDSHGSSYSMCKVLEKHRATLSGVIHLGDGVEEFRTLSSLAGTEKLIFAEVCGNLEQYSMHVSLRPPQTRVLEVEGVRILLAHGHMQNVGYGTEQLAALARAQSCRAALHGHTHVKRHLIDRGREENETPVEILCPGSIALPRDGGAGYGVVEIRSGQILMYTLEV